MTDTTALQALADKVEACVVYYVFDQYSGDQEFWSLSEDRAKAFREAIQAKVGKGAYYRVSSHPLDQAFFDDDADCAPITRGAAMGEHINTAEIAAIIEVME